MTDRPDSAFHSQVEAAITASRERRHETQRTRRRRSLAVPATITAGWLMYVFAADHSARVLDNWRASITMVFGSFVAGSTPQGGGAVAFPVFTKMLDVPTEVARGFGLFVQTFGMGTAAIIILLSARRVDRRTLLIMLPPALIGFGFGLAVISDRDAPFSPSTLSAPYVRVGFTIMVVAMAVVMWLQLRRPLRIVRTSLGNSSLRTNALLVAAALLGGLISSLAGSGADVMLYIAAVVLLGLDPRVGVPTSIILMASLSLVGFIYLGFVQGQLNITLDSNRSTVIAVNDRPIALHPETDRLVWIDNEEIDLESAPPVRPMQHDTFGMLISAVPIVTWFGSLGSLIASKVTARTLVGFVLLLALTELLTTVMFVGDLRTNPALAATLLLGMTGAIGLLLVLHVSRIKVFGLAGTDPAAVLTDDMVDARLGFERLLDGGGDVT